MNLDTLSYIHAIRAAASRVQSAEIGGSWILMGYVEGDEGAKKLNLLTINVIKQGSIWRDLLTSLEDDQIMYGYAKLDFGAGGDGKVFLIHWVGNDVGENEKSGCMPHLNEVRNLLPGYDYLINSMDPLDIQSKVHTYLTRAMVVNVDDRPARLHSNSEFVPLRDESMKMRLRSASLKKQEKDSGGLMRTYTASNKLDPLAEAKGKMSIDLLEDVKHTTNPYRNPKLPKFKVAIIGSIAVGKTSIYISYGDGGSALVSPHLIVSTTHADCMSRRVTVEQQVFTLELWDTAGQERFMAFGSTWTRNAKVVLIVYDITDRESFKEIPKWLDIAKQFADSRAIYFLVGNKADLTGRRVVTEAEAVKFASRHEMIFMECSGLTGFNILKLFEHISRMIVMVYPDLLSAGMTREHSDSTIRLPVCANSSSDSVLSSPHKRHGCNQCK